MRLHHRALTGRARRRGPALTAGLAGAAAALLWTVLSLGGGQAALTVAQAATIAVRPITAAVAEPRDDQTALPGVRAAGLAFPYWGDRFGWRATGMRTDRLDGRRLTTVFYRRGAARIAYTIVAGPALAARSRSTSRPRHALSTSTDGGRTIVTWMRRGHTCVLSGRDVPAGALQSLAGSELATGRGTEPAAPSGHEHDLPAGVPALELAVGIAHLLERVHPGDRDLQLAAVDQIGQLGQYLGAGSGRAAFGLGAVALGARPSR